MSLRNDANTLCNAIEGVLAALDRYGGEPGRDFIREMHSRLEPAAKDFRTAVSVDSDRDSAAEILAEIDPIIDSIAAATTKGEIPVFNYRDKNLDLYFHLHTIFRESRFRNSIL